MAKIVCHRENGYLILDLTTESLRYTEHTEHTEQGKEFKDLLLCVFVRSCAPYKELRPLW